MSILSRATDKERGIILIATLLAAVSFWILVRSAVDLLMNTNVSQITIQRNGEAIIKTWGGQTTPQDVLAQELQERVTSGGRKVLHQDGRKQELYSLLFGAVGLITAVVIMRRPSPERS